MATTATTREVPQEAETPTGRRSHVNAKIGLEFLRDAASGVTYLAGSEQEPPLKVVRAFTLPDGTSLVHLHNVSGGLLGGDQLAQKIILGEQANVQVTTTGATRIYRHRAGYSATTQQSEFIVGRDALLEYLPDATIPFAGARFQQSSSIQLADGAGLFWWEILAPGREAREEVFRYEKVEIRTRIAAEGRIIAAENLCFGPASRKTCSLTRLGPYRYLATFYVCRVGLTASTWRAAEDHLREHLASLSQAREAIWGVSSLVAHGLVIRCLAKNGREIGPGLQAIWRATKLYLYQREAIPPRKVN